MSDRDHKSQVSSVLVMLLYNYKLCLFLLSAYIFSWEILVENVYSRMSRKIYGLGNTTSHC